MSDLARAIMRYEQRLCLCVIIKITIVEYCELMKVLKQSVKRHWLDPFHNRKSCNYTPLLELNILD